MHIYYWGVDVVFGYLHDRGDTLELGGEMDEGRRVYI